MDDLYREEILDHYRSSAHRGRLPNADTTYEDDNPLCGDRVRMDVRFAEDGSIAEARFSGEGCAISQATASMLCDEIAGKSAPEVAGWDKHKVLDLLGISLTPVRIRCALLPLKVLQAALLKSNASSGVRLYEAPAVASKNLPQPRNRNPNTKS